MYDLVPLILACAIATYATRVGGHLILSRFGKINHRVEAALDAVPTAVLAALVAPALISKGWAETGAVLIAVLVASRFSMIPTVLIGLASVVFLRMVL